MSRLYQNTVADQAGVSSRLPTVDRAAAAPTIVPRRRTGWRGPNNRGQWQCTGKHGCERWLSPDDFTERKSTRNPYTYCHSCKAKHDKARVARPEVAEKLKAAQRRYWRRERTSRRKETRWRRERVQKVLRELIAAGHPPDRLCQELGVNWLTMKRWRDGTSVFVHRSTYRKVEALASRLRHEA